MEKLENIDSETDNLDITFVKMADARYARKWGVTKLPAIVYFRKRFPSIYRGLLLLNLFRFNECYFKWVNYLFRWSYVRRRSARVASEKSLPPARAEYLYVCPDRHISGVRPLHSLPFTMLQTASSSTTAARQTTVDGCGRSTHIADRSREQITVHIPSTCVMHFKRDHLSSIIISLHLHRRDERRLDCPTSHCKSNDRIHLLIKFKMSLPYKTPSIVECIKR